MGTISKNNPVSWAIWKGLSPQEKAKANTDAYNKKTAETADSPREVEEKDATRKWTLEEQGRLNNTKPDEAQDAIARYKWRRGQQEAIDKAIVSKANGWDYRGGEDKPDILEHLNSIEGYNSTDRERATLGMPRINYVNPAKSRLVAIDEIDEPQIAELKSATPNVKDNTPTPPQKPQIADSESQETNASWVKDLKDKSTKVP